MNSKRVKCADLYLCTSWFSFIFKNFSCIHSIADRVRHRFLIKGTVRVILSDLSYKDGSVRFTTIPLKLCLIMYEYNIIIYNFKNWLYSIVITLFNVYFRFKTYRCSLNIQTFYFQLFKESTKI